MCRVTSSASPLIPGRRRPFTSTWRRRVHHGRRLHSPHPHPLPESTHFLTPPAFYLLSTESQWNVLPPPCEHLSFKKKKKKKGGGRRFLLNRWRRRRCLARPPSSSTLSELRGRSALSPGLTNVYVTHLCGLGYKQHEQTNWSGRLMQPFIFLVLSPGWKPGTCTQVSPGSYCICNRNKWMKGSMLCAVDVLVVLWLWPVCPPFTSLSLRHCSEGRC